MMKPTMRGRWFVIGILLVVIVSLSGCAQWQQATRAQRGTAIGGATGAAAGVAIGKAASGTEGAIIGGIAGAIVGGLAGHQIGAYMDRQEQALQQVAAQSEAVSVSRSHAVLTATFKSDILFDFDSAVIKPGGYAELDRVGRVLNEYPQTMLRVEGHTDATGTEAYNQDLSERRALAVKNALIQRGISAARIEAVGYGESMPVSSSAAANRRVNIVITPVQG